MGHLKIINFPFGTNGKLIIFRCPNAYAHYGTEENGTVIYLIINFYSDNSKIVSTS